ncbi:phage tail tube protein [Streptomyces sp. NPDC006365]|uniref:phage tail tube protein n=1 Tax=Streptomyces sp. NPDC006365 TaxID=3364744 RepID=UPI0036CF4352
MPKYNARDVEFQVQDPDTPGTWVAIGGLNTFSKSHEEETTDTTTYASKGQAESQKMQIGKQLTIEGFHIRNPADPGQELVRELSELLGEDGLGGFRFAHKNDTSWEQWTAHVTLGDQGGGNNDKVSWSATFTRSGASTTAGKA